MTKKEMVDFIAKKSDMTKKQASLALGAVLEGITDALKAGDKVTFIGFGTFKVKERKARTGINPQNKKPIKIAAKKVPVFRPSLALKAKMGKKKKS